MRSLVASLVASVAVAGAAAPVTAAGCPHNPDALGVSRVLEVDTTGGPRFGSLQYRRTLGLGPKEVVLTFDDGPHPKHTVSILKALDEECVKATFFPVGIWAKHVPDVMQMVAERGHTIGAAAGAGDRPAIVNGRQASRQCPGAVAEAEDEKPLHHFRLNSSVWSPAPRQALSEIGPCARPVKRRR